MNIIAMTSAQGTLLTIAIVLLAGVIVISEDMNWFD
jgi:hypothetical protein